MAPTGNSYETQCYHCKGLHDAMQATWCSCIVKERTLACASCLKCFCTAPAAFKRSFWSNAPQLLWDRKMKEHVKVLPRQNAPPDKVGRPLVLVVDDEREVQLVAIRTSESLGYEVVLARDGAEGLALAALYKPDLVLTEERLKPSATHGTTSSSWTVRCRSWTAIRPRGSCEDARARGPGRSSLR